MTPHDNPLANRMRAIVDNVRAIATSDGPDDTRERYLAAASLLAGAAVLVWPKGRKLPVPPDTIVRVVRVGNYLWERRYLWLPATGSAAVVDLNKHRPNN